MKKIIEKSLKWILSIDKDSSQKVVNIKMLNSNRLKGKRIVITGGGKSLGFYMARKCIKEGARIVICGRNKLALEKSAAKLGVDCMYLVYDISNTAAAARFLDDCIHALGGPIDCLICNAGINNYERTFLSVDKERFDRLCSVNIKGTYFLSQQYLEYKRQNAENGNLIILSSETGNIYYETPYGLSKASLNEMTRMMAGQAEKTNVRVNAIAPGGTISEMTAWYTKKDDGNLFRKCSSGRIFVPEEVAEVTCFLASEQSRCINGQIIHTNAGNHMRVYWE